MGKKVVESIFLPAVVISEIFRNDAIFLRRHKSERRWDRSSQRNFRCELFRDAEENSSRPSSCCLREKPTRGLLYHITGLESGPKCGQPSPSRWKHFSSHMQFSIWLNNDEATEFRDRFSFSPFIRLKVTAKLFVMASSKKRNPYLNPINCSVEFDCMLFVRSSSHHSGNDDWKFGKPSAKKEMEEISRGIAIKVVCLREIFWYHDAITSLS